MRRMLGALVTLLLLTGAAASAFGQNSVTRPIPVTRTVQLRWCTWTPQGATGLSDTTFLAGAYGTDTTEAINTGDWSWAGAGGNTMITATQPIGRLWAVVKAIGIGGGAAGTDSVGFVDSNLDSIAVFVEQSMDGINFSNGGAVKSLATWHFASSDVNSFLGTANEAPKVVLDSPFYLTGAAGAITNTLGGFLGSPFLRFRVRSSAGANDKVSGLKFFVTYFAK